MIHEQLAAGEIYYEARDQLAKLADKLKGHRRTPRETPTVNPVFIVEMHLMMTDGAPQASSVVQKERRKASICDTLGRELSSARALAA